MGNSPVVHDSLAAASLAKLCAALELHVNVVRIIQHVPLTVVPALAFLLPVHHKPGHVMVTMIAHKSRPALQLNAFVWTLIRALRHILTDRAWKSPQAQLEQLLVLGLFSGVSGLEGAAVVGSRLLRSPGTPPGVRPMEQLYYWSVHPTLRGDSNMISLPYQ